MIDRRVQKTRQTLHHALISLILEKGYEAVTVQNIIDRANVGRSTFYAHFVSKEDLLKAGLSELSKMLKESQKASLSSRRSNIDQCFGFSLAMFEHANDHKDVYRAIVGKQSGAMVINSIKEMLAELVRTDLKTLAKANVSTDIPLNAIIQFVVGAFISTLVWWIEQSPELSPSEADTIFRRLTLPAIASFGIN